MLIAALAAWTGVAVETNVKLLVEYDGTSYAGWQMQPDCPTIQGELAEALRKTLELISPVYGAGRTDAGVHARGQVANLIVNSTVPIERLPLALNSHLPADIAVRGAWEVPHEFNARHNAVSREYRYYILNAPLPSPLLRLYSYHYHGSLNLEAMAEALTCLVGRHDFAALSCPEADASSVREVHEATCRRLKGGLLEIRIVANAFIYRMMRIVAGSLLQVGRGRWTAEDFQGVLASEDCAQAGPALPARGLVLERVSYREMQVAPAGPG